jgi:hypothetical protein
LPAVLNQHPNVGRTIPIGDQAGQTDTLVGAPGTVRVLALGPGQCPGGVSEAVGDAMEAVVQRSRGAATEHGEHRLGVVSLEGSNPNRVGPDAQGAHGGMALMLEIVSLLLDDRCCVGGVHWRSSWFSSVRP